MAKLLYYIFKPFGYVNIQLGEFRILRWYTASINYNTTDVINTKAHFLIETKNKKYRFDTKI